MSITRESSFTPWRTTTCSSIRRPTAARLPHRVGPTRRRTPPFRSGARSRIWPSRLGVRRPDDLGQRCPRPTFWTVGPSAWRVRLLLRRRSGGLRSLAGRSWRSAGPLDGGGHYRSSHLARNSAPPSGMRTTWPTGWAATGTYSHPRGTGSLRVESPACLPACAAV